MLTGKILLAAATMLLTVTGANAQQSAPKAPRATEKSQDDIIVEGYRKLKGLPTELAAPPAVSGVQNRVRFELSERVARCALRARIGSLDRVRAVVDGEYNSARHAVAQDRLRRIYITCGEGFDALSVTTADAPPMTLSTLDATMDTGFTGGPVYSDPAPLGRSIYDRGALIIQVLKEFAPDLQLTREQLQDREVRERFVLREQPRNRFRLPLDQHYFNVASCMVQMEPQLSVRLALSDRPAKLSGLQAAIINRARMCVNNAKNVRVDATQFRIYIADAVYCWTLAARGVGSLIPREQS